MTQWFESHRVWSCALVIFCVSGGLYWCITGRPDQSVARVVELQHLLEYAEGAERHSLETEYSSLVQGLNYEQRIELQQVSHDLIVQKRKVFFELPEHEQIKQLDAAVDQMFASEAAARKRHLRKAQSNPESQEATTINFVSTEPLPRIVSTKEEQDLQIRFSRAMQKRELERRNDTQRELTRR